MISRSAAAIVLLLLSQPLMGSALVLSPAVQPADPTCTIFVGVTGLSNAAGLDIVITWNPERLACDGVFFVRERLPGFSAVLETIDNQAGRLEVVQDEQSPGATRTPSR